MAVQLSLVRLANAFDLTAAQTGGDAIKLDPADGGAGPAMEISMHKLCIQCAMRAGRCARGDARGAMRAGR
ncbi:MAG TPA: hypothetical protein VGL19_05920, partial [Polyangiaceae bacterium]